MQNLIYDRTETDVEYALMNQGSSTFLKGSYNYTDMNRIEDWCAYLASKLNQYSYPISIEEHENQHSILKNGSLRLSRNNWSKGAYTIPTAVGEYTTLGTSNGSIYLYQNFDYIQGDTQETKQIIYACAKVRKRTSSEISVSLDALKNNQRATSISLSSIDGDLNDGNWHTLSVRTSTLPDNNFYIFRSIWIAGSNIEGEIDVKDIYLYNLTDIWGRGDEPSKSECDENLTSLWNVIDFPTKAEMKRIRDNLETLKNAYYSFTSVPENLEKMTYQKANDLEKVLYEINQLYENMVAGFLYSGTFYSGEGEGLII